MNNTTETIAGHERRPSPSSTRTADVSSEGIEAKRSVRSVVIVMVREHRENLLKVLLVEDQQPIETR